MKRCDLRVADMPADGAAATLAVMLFVVGCAAGDVTMDDARDLVSTQTGPYGGRAISSNAPNVDPLDPTLYPAFERAARSAFVHLLDRWSYGPFSYQRILRGYRDDMQRMMTKRGNVTLRGMEIRGHEVTAEFQLRGPRLVIRLYVDGEAWITETHHLR